MISCSFLLTDKSWNSYNGISLNVTSLLGVCWNKWCRFSWEDCLSLNGNKFRSLGRFKWRNMDQGCVTAFTKNSLVLKFGKFNTRNLRMKAIILRKQKMKTHLKNATKWVPNISLFTNVVYHVLSCCIFSRKFIRWNLFQKDNSTKPSVSTTWLNIREVTSKIQDCDSAEDEALSWIIMYLPLYQSMSLHLCSFGFSDTLP